MFEISFTTSGDIFIGQDKYYEAARMLRRVADNLEAFVSDGPVIDINGNRVGSWYIDHDEKG